MKSIQENEKEKAYAEIDNELKKYGISREEYKCKWTIMDLSPFRQNFQKLQTRQIFYHSWKEHPLFSRFAKFGCKIL